LLADFFYRGEPQPAMVMTQPWISVPFSRETDVTQARALPRAPVNALPPAQPAPRELSQDELSALLTAGTDAGRIAVAGLLIGLTCDELIKLRWHHVDFDGGKIHVAGDSQRSLPVNETLSHFLNSVRGDVNQPEATVLSDGQGKPFTVDDVRTLIVYTSLDAGIEHAQEITPQAIRYSYLAFLLSQGVRFADIGRIVGRLTTDEMATCAGLVSPQLQHVSLEQVERTVPALRDFKFAERAI